MLSVDDLCKEFNTTFDLEVENKVGLTEEQAKENLKKYGPNKMRNMPEFTKFLVILFFLMPTRRSLTALGLFVEISEFFKEIPLWNPTFCIKSAPVLGNS